MSNYSSDREKGSSVNKHGKATKERAMQRSTETVPRGLLLSQTQLIPFTAATKLLVSQQQFSRNVTLIKKLF